LQLDAVENTPQARVARMYGAFITTLTFLFVAINYESWTD